MISKVWFTEGLFLLKDVVSRRECEDYVSRAEEIGFEAAPITTARGFESSTIRNWIDKGQTALCPRCGMDFVIGSYSGYEMTDEFLGAMRVRWFPQSKTA